MSAQLVGEASGETCATQKEVDDQGAAGGATAGDKRKTSVIGRRLQPKRLRVMKDPKSIKEPKSRPPFTPTLAGALKATKDVLVQLDVMRRTEVTRQLRAMCRDVLEATKRKESAEAARLANVMLERVRPLGLDTGSTSDGVNGFNTLHACVSRLYHCLVWWDQRRRDDYVYPDGDETESEDERDSAR